MGDAEVVCRRCRGCIYHPLLSMPAPRPHRICVKGGNGGGVRLFRTKGGRVSYHCDCERGDIRTGYLMATDI